MDNHKFRVFNELKNRLAEKNSKISGKPYFMPVMKIVSALLLLGFLSFAMYSFFVYFLPSLQDQGCRFITVENQVAPADSLAMIEKQSKNEKEILQLNRQLEKLSPGSGYIVINTTENKFKLYSRKKLVREGICSTGSYTQLVSGDNREWLFHTPKGIFRILNKKTSPVWKKPDWAFIEDGLPVPSPNDPSRFEYGTLGDYSLSLGDGYMIHGTLYKRFLGMPVTHGCIRLGDDDLKTVYTYLPIGSRVYIF